MPACGGASVRAGVAEALNRPRRNSLIEVLDEAGQPKLRYRVHRCWVSEFQALPDLDANANAVAIQHLKLENEGWERDEIDPPSEGPRRRR